MKNKIVILFLIMLFLIGLVLASIFVNKYSLDMYIENNNSGDNISSSENINNEINEKDNNEVVQNDAINDNNSEVVQNDAINDNNNEIVQNNTDKQENNNEKESEEMEILEMTNENFEEEVLKSEKTVLIDFYADWCGPCKMMAPVVERVANENPDLKVVKVNIDNEEEIAIKYMVMSIPTFVVIKDGEEVNRIVGAVDKSELESIIK